MGDTAKRGSAADARPGRAGDGNRHDPPAEAAEPIIELAGVEKVYGSGKVGFPALTVDLAIMAARWWR